MFLDIGEDNCVCHACGFTFFHHWVARDANVIAVEHFPIKCKQCGKKEAYRIETEQK